MRKATKYPFSALSASGIIEDIFRRSKSITKDGVGSNRADPVLCETLVIMEIQGVADQTYTKDLQPAES